MDKPVDVSVVIPARNAANDIEDQLRALGRQVTAARFEVVIGDNGSTDATAEVATGVADELGLDLRIADASRAPGINVARNEGVRAARGRYVILCDADDRVSPGWVEAHWSAFQRGATLTGGQVVPFGADVRARFGSDVPVLIGDFNFLLFPIGANCGAARAVFDDLGLFDETFAGGGDEVEFFWRAQLAGHVLTPVADATVEYRLRDGLGELYRQSKSYGRGHVRIYRHFRTAGMPRQFGRSLLRLAKAVLRGVAAREGSRQQLAIACGTVVGRATESMRQRTIYL